MGCGSWTDYKNYGRQPYDYKTDRISTVTTSDIRTGDLPGSKAL